MPHAKTAVEFGSPKYYEQPCLLFSVQCWHMCSSWKKYGVGEFFRLGCVCLFGGLEGGGVWRKVGRGVYILNIKNFSKTGGIKPPKFHWTSFFSSFLLQIMPPASVALRSQVFLTKLVKTKHQVVHREQSNHRRDKMVKLSKSIYQWT